jgi:hypothetical protein
MAGRRKRGKADSKGTDDQPASSFELPASYRKFNPEALIEQIKQSDVWVSRPGAAEASHP